MSGKSSGQNTVRVQRYWPGKAPQFPSTASTDAEDETAAFRKKSLSTKKQPLIAPSAALSLAFTPSASDALVQDDTRTKSGRDVGGGREAGEEEEVPIPVLPEDSTDRRLRRLRIQQQEEEKEDISDGIRSRRSHRQANVEEEEAAQRLAARHRRREVFEGEVVSVAISSERRGFVAQPVQQETIEVKKESSESSPIDRAEQETMEDEESDKSSEYTDSDDEDQPVLFKPVFVPKHARGTIKDEETLERERVEEEKKKQQEDEIRKKESYRLVEENVRRELKEFEQRNNDLLLVDDRDDLDPEAERAAWQLRELERIKRDRKIERERQKEMEELERRREMTDAERRRDDLEAGIDRFKKDKGQMKFMQRFYHKGAFYQDQEIMQRDFTAPTLEDRFNKEVLPEVLQRRQNIGLRGATKWTHLANEDTSQKNAAWSQKSEVNSRVMKRMGGLRNDFDRPSAKKRRQ